MIRPTSFRPTAFAYTLALTLVAVIVGCSHANKPLADLKHLREHRELNQTRASLAAQVAPRFAAGETPIEPGGNSSADPQLAPVDERNDDGYFVGLAISGGGSRSANFAAASMFELQRLGILQRVDYISSVSGGSLTAAYYCLFDEAWNPGTVQAKLTESFASDVIGQMLLPWNAITQMFTSWDRTDLLANSFKRKLFSGRGGRALTFADLRPDRPRLLINATDLQSGRRFVFCNESFDRLNSDLSRYPIANAVAASAAAPVLMHHVTLRDYSTRFEQYVHLIDGGINDNLGIATLIETYYAHVAAADRQDLPDPYPKGAIFIVLDARTEFDAQLSERADMGFLPGLVAGAGVTSTVLLNRVSSATMADVIVRHSPDGATVETVRKNIAQLENEGYLAVEDRLGKPVRVVHIALSRVNQVSNTPFKSFSERVNSIATYFNIDPTEAYHLYKAAELLISERFDPHLRQIASDLRAEGETNPRETERRRQ